MKTAISKKSVTVTHTYDDKSPSDIEIEFDGDMVRFKQGNDWIYAYPEQAKKIAEIILEHFKTTYND